MDMSSSPTVPIPVDLAEISATLVSFPQALAALLTPVDPSALAERPAPGEWCVLEVIGHLIATDSGAFRDRIKAIMAGEPEISQFDPWDAINNRDFTVDSVESLVDELASQRQTSAELIQDLDQSDLQRSASYGDYGEFAVGDFVHEWPFHDQDHLKQIVDNLKPYYLRAMTPVMRDALSG